MVIPLGGPGMGSGMGSDEVPEGVKNSYKCPWWFMTTLLTVTAIGMFIAALNVLGGFIMLMIAFWSYYMVRNNCQEMSQYCMFSFGLMCAMQAVFDLIALLMNVAGRTTRSVSPTTAEHGTQEGGMRGSTVSRSYTTTMETTPFFDEARGWHYNLQSGMMIASFVVMLLAALLSKATYNLYPTSLFDPQDDADAPLGGHLQGGFGGRQAGYGGGPGGGLSGGGNAGANYGSGGAQSGGGRPAAPTMPNWGTGHRLGS